ncbi:thymidine kinase [Cavenderia fasciculata]|uniref:Thymidine kinase n=1 Tax=Cavenderia fasciculata TaxID=261658 RepID=F4PNY9_CACFS|nr:thymidine kinase [Cavenderia fasciculata]EGG22668.1 thymidine kinase [Cavenderia fasciculata]|eukprot:XP_004360519.1 thymidine kinase [Cavenderia fasciculata]
MFKNVVGKIGKIQVIYGPMFSGKTTELIRRIKRFNLTNQKCLLIKYSKDTRYNEIDRSLLYTHDKQNYQAFPCSVLEEAKDKALDYDVIGIDEGQFFQDIVPFSEDLANRGKTVIVAALDGTFQRKPFGTVLELVPKAESITKLTAVCMQCFKDAPFTKRIVPDETVELIGGADKYISVCRECYHAEDINLNQNQNQNNNNRNNNNSNNSNKV